MYVFDFSLEVCVPHPLTAWLPLLHAPYLAPTPSDSIFVLRSGLQEGRAA